MPLPVMAGLVRAACRGRSAGIGGRDKPSQREAAGRVDAATRFVGTLADKPCNGERTTRF